MINLVFMGSDSFDRMKTYNNYTTHNDRKRIDYILNLNNHKYEGYSYISNKFTSQMTDHRACVGLFEI